MSNQLTTSQNFSALKQSLTLPEVRGKFDEILGKRSAAFVSSILTIVSNNEQLKNADSNSVIMSALVAATLDLPINPALGFAAIVPYRDRTLGQVAQFQIMTKGIIQLAERSGQYQRLNNSVVYEGQLIKEDPFTGEYVFDYYNKKSDKIIGYMAYFKLNNGFEKYLYMTYDEVQKHAQRYSKVYQKGFGVWVDDFDKMALKTVLKQLLSRYGILSIEMERAVTYDQAVIKGNVEDVDNAQIIYTDNADKQTLTDSLAGRYAAEGAPKTYDEYEEIPPEVKEIRAKKVDKEEAVKQGKVDF